MVKNRCFLYKTLSGVCSLPELCLDPKFLFLILVVPQRGRTALSIAMQGSHTDTAALLQAHAKARAL